MMTVALDLDDIQGIIVRGYGDLKAAAFVLLEIGDPALGAAWLRALADGVTTGRERSPTTGCNVAFTHAGLAKLGLAPETLAMFSYEFIGGMAAPHRQRVLGDLDDDAPQRWSWGGPSTMPIDALLLLYAGDQPALEQLYSAHAQMFTANGLVEVQKLGTAELDDTEHFGFRDGISQPIIEGLAKSGPAANTIKAGEFILGYPNEYGRYTDRPTIRPGADSRALLPRDPSGSVNLDLGCNGSYLIFRQLSQDVSGFWGFLEGVTRNPDGSSNAAARTRLASKMVGRWPDGAPLAISPNRDDPRLRDSNDFGYGNTDPDGFHCPIGAHIRRANPRDSLDPRPGTERSIAVGKRHRILRRGRKYGDPPDPDTLLDGQVPVADGQDRGLHFICLSANIARQFEFVQQTWISNPKFDELYDDVDPLIGLRRAGADTFTVPAKPVRGRVSGLPRFVSVRGGGYFFLPGIRAIRYLASLEA